MNGLVICGGQSSRMGNDKSMLDYHGLPQRYYIYNLLKQFCDKVYISCNKNQEENIAEGFNYLVDEQEDIGPMAAILKAFKEHEKSWLVIGCDYPFFQKDELSLLIENRDAYCMATTYYNNDFNIPEPLLGIYEVSFKEILLKEFEKGNYSLKHFLLSYNTHYISPQNIQIIQSVDTKLEYEEALKKLK